jgi:hypothetical protein
MKLNWNGPISNGPWHDGAPPTIFGPQFNTTVNLPFAKLVPSAVTPFRTDTPNAKLR